MGNEPIDIKSIFSEALQKKDPQERAAYLDKVCGNDMQLRATVEALLKAHQDAGDFLKAPAFGAEATLDTALKIEGPGTIIGRYELLELIGEGGMGLVYLAEQKEPVKRRVALKIIKLGMDSKQVIARFEAERQALAVLDHPNIAHVYDAGTTETGRPYFVMEYVKGMSITRYCDERKLNIEQRLRLFEQVCEAVHHAHQKGIIHRDTKPSNILVSVHGDRAVPKIIDFGIAKAITQPLTDKTFVTFQGQLLGTPEYMSPEQVDLATQDIDTRSDIYSLGVVLYELLAGVLPFERESFERAGFAEIQQMVREQEPASPSIRLTHLGEKAKTITASRGTQVIALARRLHRELEWIPLKAMRKDRCRRYKSASEMADDVRNYLNGNPLIAGPETAIYRVRKFVHKHAGSVATVALVAVAILLGLVISTAMYFRAESMRVQAEQAKEKETIARVRAEQAENTAEQQRKLAEQRAKDLRRSLYVNSIQLADSKYKEGNIQRVRELLDSCPEDFRGWEWNRLNYVIDQSSKTLRAHSNGVTSIAVSPDGKQVISASTDNTIKIWDTVKGIELMTISKEHGGIITCAALSPDGRRVIAGDRVGQIDVWELTTSKRVMTLTHERGVYSVTFSPDGSRIISAGPDPTAKLWDASTGTERTTLKFDSQGIYSAVFSPDGKRIAVTCFDCRITILDAVTTKEIMTLKGHKIFVDSVSFSPDNKVIVSAGVHEIKKWDATTGAELMTLRGHGGWIRSVAFSPDGKHIVSSGDDKTIRVWDIATGENMLILRGHEGSVSSVAFTPDGKKIVSGSWDNTIKVWNVGAERESTRFVGHKGKSHPVAFSSDGRRLVSASQDGTVKLWDVESGSEIMSLCAGGVLYPLRSTALSPDGNRIASAPISWGTTTVNIWDAATGVKTVTLRGHQAPVTCLAFSPDNKRVVSGSGDKAVKVWDVATGNEVMTIKGHNTEVLSVAFSPDGKRIASASYDFLPQGLFGKEGETKVKKGEIKVWDALTEANLMSLEHDVFRSNVVFSPDSRRLVCGSEDGTIKVWDSTTGAELTVLRAHADSVTSVAFSPDGKRIISGSWDDTAKLWDSETGNELLSLSDYDVIYRDAVVSPDGRSIAAGTWVGTIVLWESAKPAGGYEPRKNGEAARKIVDELYQKHGYYYEVIGKLKADNTLDECVRKLAMQIANSRKWEDAQKLKEQSWEVVRLPGRDVNEYRLALEKAEKANALEPNDPDILKTLGVAQYRVGSYEDALKTLTKTDKIRTDVNQPRSEDVAFIAMTLQKLGRAEEAKAALERLRALLKDEQFAKNKVAQGFLAEAEKLITGEEQRK